MMSMHGNDTSYYGSPPPRAPLTLACCCQLTSGGRLKAWPSLCLAWQPAWHMQAKPPDD
jgi:hypothetical protein